MFTHRHQHKSDKFNNENEITNLADIQEGRIGIIIEIIGGKMSTKRLADLGLTPGTEIKVIGRTFFSGPIQIEFNGSRLAIGRRLASKIIVRLK